ncbi:hypothetical protein [Amphritea sp. HPY]|uniref:hypothetical protein n=1 Tax=Amphritea sp. HPY TaxID=3421652 RepID=UPI003D7D0B1D
MTVNVRQGGVWYEAAPHVKQGGVWYECQEVWNKQAGVWEQSFANVQTYTSTGTRTNVNIFADFGSPTEAGDFIWINNGDCRSGGSTYAVQTGTFPSGSTLTIINNGYIRGRGGKGGNCATQSASSGSPGQTALTCGYSCTIDNTNGYIYGGGGGGGGASDVVGKGIYYNCAGGGGAGSNAGAGGTRSGTGDNGDAGSLTGGGAGGYYSSRYGGAGGGLGASGATAPSHNSYRGSGGAAGKAIAKNGKTVTITAGNNSTQVKGAVS